MSCCNWEWPSLATSLPAQSTSINLDLGEQQNLIDLGKYVYIYIYKYMGHEWIYVVVCLSIYLFVYRSVYLSIYLSIYLSACTYMCIHQCITNHESSIFGKWSPTKHHLWGGRSKMFLGRGRPIPSDPSWQEAPVASVKDVLDLAALVVSWSWPSRLTSALKNLGLSIFSQITTHLGA